ncbi:hypothetical protein CHARACLAT_015040 [Characodon lateralis]|uniref:Uncharacterized protein n=1 Tax=Characodon lateralis TaxID=208331 RepID=A0ABU7DGZ5_9TELE|nr:hypothetical protein [Characodon lateralis]
MHTDMFMSDQKSLALMLLPQQIMGEEITLHNTQICGILLQTPKDLSPIFEMLVSAVASINHSWLLFMWDSPVQWTDSRAAVVRERQVLLSPLQCWLQNGDNEAWHINSE